MPVELMKGEAGWTLGLSGVADVFDTAVLHATALEAAANAPRGVVARVGSVESIDTAATQVLLALKLTLASDGRALTFEDIPAPVLEFWRVAGLTEALG